MRLSILLVLALATGSAHAAIISIDSSFRMGAFASNEQQSQRSVSRGQFDDVQVSANAGVQGVGGARAIWFVELAGINENWEFAAETGGPPGEPSGSLRARAQVAMTFEVRDTDESLNVLMFQRDALGEGDKPDYGRAVVRNLDTGRLVGRVVGDGNSNSDSLMMPLLAGNRYSLVASIFSDEQRWYGQSFHEAEMRFLWSSPVRVPAPETVSLLALALIALNLRRRRISLVG